MQGKPPLLNLIPRNLTGTDGKKPAKTPTRPSVRNTTFVPHGMITNNPPRSPAVASSTFYESTSTGPDTRE